MRVERRIMIRIPERKADDQLNDVEREVKELAVDDQRIRQEKARPRADDSFEWMCLYRTKVPGGSATAAALNYSIVRWVALTRYLEDGQSPIDNNHIENQIRPIAFDRSN